MYASMLNVFDAAEEVGNEGTQDRHAAAKRGGSTIQS